MWERLRQSGRRKRALSLCCLGVCDASVMCISMYVGSRLYDANVKKRESANKRQMFFLGRVVNEFGIALTKTRAVASAASLMCFLY